MMSEKERNTMTLNEKDVLPASSNGNNRGRSRSRNREDFRSRSRSRSRSSSRTRGRREIDLAHRDATPLIPEDALPRQKPPVRGPEIDEEDEDEKNNDNGTHGIDDGFLEEGEVDGVRTVKPLYPNGPRRGSIPPFPHAPPDYAGPGITIPGDPTPRVIPDINVYQHKKTLAQGMMDLALLSSNANQLRYVLELKDRHAYYHFSLTFIIASLLIQVIVGIGLVLNSRYNVKNQDDICKADKINNLITIGILLITIINVFISAFGVAEVHS